jgi:amino acid permease
MHQLSSSELLKERSLWIMIAFTVVAPLSCFQSLDALKYTSSLSMTFIIFLMIVIVLFAFPTYSGLNPCKEITSNQGCKGHEEFYLLNTGSLRVFSVFVFGYTCQQVNDFLIYIYLNVSSCTVKILLASI